MTQKIKSITLSLALLGLLIAYAYGATRLFLASQAVSSNTIEGLERSTRLAPWNAEYSLLLARSRTLGLLDFRGGIQEYQRGMALNPYSSRGWLDLAAAYQMSGNAAGQSEAIEKAIQVDPHTPAVAWEVASFYVLQGKIEKALPHYRTVLSSQVASTPAVLDILWPSTHQDAELILNKVLPPDAAVHAEFLNFAVREKNLDAAGKIWGRVLQLQPPIATRDAFPYIQALVDAQRPAEALQAWKQLAAIQPQLREYLPAADNLIVNGDFESDLLGGGLEWVLVKVPDVDLKIDSLEFHAGTHSLAATFEPGPVQTLGISQVIPVEGGAEYRFSCFMKADELTTASGPRIAISDSATKERLFFSDDLRGSTAWKEVTASFRTRPETKALKIEVVREPATLIKGKFYVDDLVLRRSP